MIHLGKTLRIDRLPDAPGQIGEAFHIRERERFTMLFDEEEPITAPRDVARDLACAGNIHGDCFGFAITRHVDKDTSRLAVNVAVMTPTGVFQFYARRA